MPPKKTNTAEPSEAPQITKAKRPRVKKDVTTGEEPKAPKAPKAPKDVKFDDCTVCCQPYTACKRKSIKCLYCEYEACAECLQRYLLSKADAHCMNCKRAWTKDFLRNPFTKTFVFESLPKHYTDVLVELEKSLFPETLQRLEQANEQEKLRVLESDAQHIMSHIDESKAVLRVLRTVHTEFKKYPVQQVSSQLDRNNIVRTLRSQNYLYGGHSGQIMTLIQTQKFRYTAHTEQLNVPESYVDSLYLTAVWKIIEEYNQVEVETSGRGRSSMNLVSQVMDELSNYRIHLFSLEDLFVVFTKVTEAMEKRMEMYFSFTEAFKRKTKGIDVPIRCSTEKCPGYLFKLTQGSEPTEVEVEDEAKQGEKADKKAPKVAPMGECKVCSTIQCIDCKTSFSSHAGQAELKAHKCDADLVKTLRLIAKSSKPCPTCKQPIDRVSGCAQMFCVNCHTAFDWESGNVIQGKIHNPHYFEWLNKGGKPEDANAPAPNQNTNEQNRMTIDGCGSQVLFSNETYSTISVHAGIRLLLNFPEDVGVVANKYFAILSFWQVMNHLLNDEIARLRPSILGTTSVDRFRVLRESFLRGRISEERWKQELHQRNHDFQIRTEEFQLYDAVVNIGSDIFNNLETQVAQVYEKYKAAVDNAVNKRSFSCIGLAQLITTSSVYNSRSIELSAREKQFVIEYTKLLTPAIDQAYTQCLELSKYYNDHLRVCVSDNNRTVFKKLMCPSDQTVSTQFTNKQLSDDYNTRKSLRFEIGSSKIATNDIDFVIQTIKDVDGLNDLLPEEQSLRDAYHFVAQVTQVFDQAYKKIDLKWNSRGVLKTGMFDKVDVLAGSMQTQIDAFTTVLNSPIMGVLARFKDIKEAYKKKKSRLQVISFLYDEITELVNWLSMCMFNQYNFVTKHLEWKNITTLEQLAQYESVLQNIKNNHQRHDYKRIVAEYEYFRRNHIIDADIFDEDYSTPPENSDHSEHSDEGSDQGENLDTEDTASSITQLETLFQQVLTLDPEMRVDYNEQLKDMVNQNKKRLGATFGIMQKMEQQKEKRRKLQDDFVRRLLTIRAMLLTHETYVKKFEEKLFDVMTEIEVAGLKIRIPKWLAFIAEPGKHFALNWKKLGTVTLMTSHSNPIWYLFSSPICSCYINDQSVHVLEAILAVLIMQPAYTSQLIQEMDERMISYKMNLCFEPDLFLDGFRKTTYRESYISFEVKLLNPVLREAFVRRMLEAMIQGEFVICGDALNFINYQTYSTWPGFVEQYPFSTVKHKKTCRLIDIAMRKLGIVWTNKCVKTKTEFLDELCPNLTELFFNVLNNMFEEVKKK